MAKKHISVTNERVLTALEESKNASRLIEEAIIYYLDSIEHDYITKEEAQSMIFDALRKVEIRNPNCSLEQIGNEMNEIFNL